MWNENDLNLEVITYLIKQKKNALIFFRAFNPGDDKWKQTHEQIIEYTGLSLSFPEMLDM